VKRRTVIARGFVVAFPTVTPEAAIRAYFAKSAVRRLRALPDGKGAQVRERMPAGLDSRLRRLSSNDWLPVGEMIALCDAIAEVLGEQAGRDLWTELIGDTYDNGLLRPMMADVRERLEGNAAADQLLRLAPQAWAMASRGCGDLRFGEGEQSVCLCSGDLLPELVHSPGMHCLFYGACQSILDQFRVRAEIVVTASEDDPETVVFAIRRRT